MATWVKCTELSGKSFLLNFDQAIFINRNEDQKHTTIGLVGGKSINVKEALPELLKNGLRA